MVQDHELLLPLVEEENICLPLPINVVSKYWNIELPMAEAIETAKKYFGFNGSILVEGIESAERHGLTCKIINSSLSELKKIIDSGIPPIVILPGIPEITQHASVITGYDDEEKTILHYIQKGNQEGEQQEGAIPEEIFEKEWSEEGRLLILLAPPDILSAVKLENDSSDKSNRLCIMAERENILKNSSDALESLNKALQIYPNNSTALHQLGSMMNEQNSSECVKFYEKCLDINKRSYLTYNGLGNFYLKTNQFEKAENYYTKAIEINPKRSAKIYKNRAYLREKQNKNSEAKDDLKSYLKYYPKAPDRGVIEQAIREI
ncbi:MAG: tetratricopeptide repeat protein [Nitrosopumilus sp.]|uniref:tetratricopeptide repeat protein n=1 Tax=Nitrosopumilus sp. TaxID=2024843 RepID=UPI00243127D8|nr:tetratricopeptide repeat protein [Nitrosopumilus sp.]MCV0366708.1 tetratricopeptide repeat protein [Nitrosopumilus sp.]